MKRRFFVMMLMGVVMLSGCGKEDSGYQSSSVYDVSYTAEDDSSSYLDDADLIEDAEPEDEDWTDEQTGTEDDANKYVEPKGIIAALVESNLNQAHSVVQVVAINPDTGEQGLVAEFSLKHATSSEVMSPNEVDDSVVRYMLAEYYSQSMKEGNHRNWFSDDYTKMIANRVFLAREFEQHAGWMDTEGNFFDVSETSGTITERGFSNSEPKKHVAIGFDDGNFVFQELAPTIEETYYSVPFDNVSEDTVAKTDWQKYYAIHQHGGDIAYPTCQFNNQECLADYYEGSTAKSKSVKVNVETLELTEYLPETDRVIWNGIVNRNKDKVAMATLSGNTRDSKVELYVASLGGGEPEELTLVPNDRLLFNITDMTQRMIFEGALNNDGKEYCVFLLEWK